MPTIKRMWTTTIMEETTEISCSPGEQTGSPSTTTTTQENQNCKYLCFEFHSHYAISDYKGEGDIANFQFSNIDFVVN